MSCSNCFNGCAEIVSDRCVRYTGLDAPALGIQAGDTLASVENSLINFLSQVLNGSGVYPNIGITEVCNVVCKYLPTCCDASINDYVIALIKAACDLQVQVTAEKTRIDVIEANYSVSCLSGVSANSGTHAILQAVIGKLCELEVDLGALTIDVDENYVKLADLDSLIAAYLAGQGTSTQYYLKMVPFTVVEYYGPLSNFDASGAGLGNWVNIYLCNGQNGTPDKRGRVGVGAISGVPGGALNAAVNPVNPGNPNYALYTATGANTVTLDITQIPSHTHAATVNDPGHSHTFDGGVRPGGGGDSTRIGVVAVLNTSVATTGVTVSNAPIGGGSAHSNIQPSLACYYIMYIP
jgi:hypothetical protein